MGRPRFSTPMIDKFAMAPISVEVFALIVLPLLISFTSPKVHTVQRMMQERPENRTFRPLMCTISVIFSVQHRSLLGRHTFFPASCVSSHILRLQEQASYGP
jgi:hypothetical protein